MATTATAMGLLYQVWANRRAAAVPGYQILRSSFRDKDRGHWARVHMPNGTLIAGKVVALTRSTVVLDHPTAGVKSIQIASAEQWETTYQLATEWPDWEPSQRRKC